MRLSRPSQSTVDYIKSITKETTGFMRLNSPEIFRRFEQEINNEVHHVYFVGALPCVGNLSRELRSINVYINDRANPYFDQQIELRVK